MKKILAAVLLLPALASAELLNPNLASEAELASVPGVDARLAAAIVEMRPHLTPSDLDSVLSASLDEDAREAAYGALFRPLNLNTATEAEIWLIPGMSRKMVHEFEEYRPYRSMDQFRREMSKYVDDAEVERLASYVFVPVSLNDASEEEIMAIPGMTARMAHEFDEYRPYRNIEQFRREIGKYVDEDEVARLESYVTLD